MNVMVMEVEERKRNGRCEIDLNANGPKTRWQGTVDMVFGGVGTCSRSNYGPFLGNNILGQGVIPDEDQYQENNNNNSSSMPESTAKKGCNSPLATKEKNPECTF